MPRCDPRMRRIRKQTMPMLPMLWQWNKEIYVEGGILAEAMHVKSLQALVMTIKVADKGGWRLGTCLTICGLVVPPPR